LNGLDEEMQEQNERRSAPSILFCHNNPDQQAHNVSYKRENEMPSKRYLNVVVRLKFSLLPIKGLVNEQTLRLNRPDIIWMH